MVKIEISDLEPIPATKAKTIFGDILHQTSVNGKKFVVNRQGKPVSVILSYNEYCRLLKEAGHQVVDG
ncbi:MAG: type II toxin-antitoxin system Phd/YefM family antitoxin [Candidatus Wallbacteria bacterium]|nr:type II toxin-antitoxin system Phd/YefM family antitoxin [Candidatus Wallbacteria bacterium]